MTRSIKLETVAINTHSRLAVVRHVLEDVAQSSTIEQSEHDSELVSGCLHVVRDAMRELDAALQPEQEAPIEA